MMRPRVVSIIGSTAFAAHETWLTERLELDLGLDQKEARYYARFVLSSLIQPEKEIDSHREKELFVYNKPSPNSSGYGAELGTLFMDTRTPEEITISELHTASCAPIEQVTKLIVKLGRRLELSRRKRHNSETSEISAISSQSSTSSYEAEFPQLPTSQPVADSPLANPLAKGSNWIRRKSSDKQFRFAFKNPAKVRLTPSGSASLPSRRTNQRSIPPPTPSSSKSLSPLKMPKDPETKVKPHGGHRTVKRQTVTPNKEKRKRKRNRKKKKKSNVESTSEYRNLATYENFDHFSMDEALNFVQSLSGQSDNSHDVDIWTNVVKEQHVKYLNGTFYFTPRESEPPSSSDKSESTKSYKTKFFIDHDELSTKKHAEQAAATIAPPAEIDKTIRKPIKCDDGLSHAARIANRMAEIIIEEADDMIWSIPVTPHPIRHPVPSDLDTVWPDSDMWPVLSDQSISPRVPMDSVNPWTIW